MKNSRLIVALFSLVVVFVFGACSSNSPKQESEELSENSGKEEDVSFFGEDFKVETPVLSSVLESNLDSLGNFEGQVKGTVSSCCKKKGCWLKVQTGSGEMRVTFKDYSFFVPTDCEGQEVILNGIVRKETTTVEELRHYAEDQGASPEKIALITEPETEIVMEATGVKVVK